MSEEFYRKGIASDPQLSQQYDRFRLIGQPGWRFCDKCWGLFFNGDPKIKGHCPAGGAHHALGFVFYLPHDAPDTVGQPGWRFCNRCWGLFFNGDFNIKGRCPAGGTHNAQGFQFVLPHDVPDTVGQPGWRFCDKCSGIFFNGDPSIKGLCPAGGAHNAQGFQFILPHRGFPNPSISIQPKPSGQRYIDVRGVGFEPNQTVLINHELKFHPSGAFQPEGIPSKVSSDSEGRWFALIPIAQDVGYVKVSAFDFGSGETAIASIG
ncbi:hypothetical protein [Bacillus cereus]|uniref:hypothetical protein n=1 Tax=Bacillus cereus TaxID=1396 RepID=UPI000BFE0B03|nr:hypothetical protein [Bacillus cereus]PGV68994.1 hypothetical protein COD84_29655 [Bacillus cereus]